jgi:hypothetical protein
LLRRPTQEEVTLETLFPRNATDSGDAFGHSPAFCADGDHDSGGAHRYFSNGHDRDLGPKDNDIDGSDHDHVLACSRATRNNRSDDNARDWNRCCHEVRDGACRHRRDDDIRCSRHVDHSACDHDDNHDVRGAGRG